MLYRALHILVGAIPIDEYKTYHKYILREKPEPAAPPTRVEKFHTSLGSLIVHICVNARRPWKLRLFGGR
jgi:hypothetical protein